MSEFTASAGVVGRLAIFYQFAVAALGTVFNVLKESGFVGKGDKRTKKGKIFRGSHGKSRPRPAALAAAARIASKTPAAKPAAAKGKAKAAK